MPRRATDTAFCDSYCVLLIHDHYWRIWHSIIRLFLVLLYLHLLFQSIYPRYYNFATCLHFFPSSTPTYFLTAHFVDKTHCLNCPFHLVRCSLKICHFVFFRSSWYSSLFENPWMPHQLSSQSNLASTLPHYLDMRVIGQRTFSGLGPQHFGRCLACALSYSTILFPGKSTERNIQPKQSRK